MRGEVDKVITNYVEQEQESINDSEKENAKKLFKDSAEIICAIKHGEQVFNEAQKSIPMKIRNLYNIMLLIVKSISINLLDLKSYGKNNQEAFKVILDLLNVIDLNNRDVEKLEANIRKAVKVDNALVKTIRNTQEELYGNQIANEVSFSTKPNKAVLVVGSNIRELEKILESLANENIDVYTHDDMMLAHTFPKFSDFSQLKGQYGYGLENCLLDFATFPGPIILTKHSLHNIENFYRGRLFTTDLMSSPKGVIKIENNDFSKVIDSAYKAKGFKKGKQCESLSIGYNFDEISRRIQEKIGSKNYKRVFIITNDEYLLEEKAYFEKMIRHTPDNVLIISFSYKYEKENFIYINSCFDDHSVLRIFDLVYKFQYPITIFMPKCNKSSISQMIYLSGFENTEIYLGKCIPLILNPSLMTTLQEIFDIKHITSVKKDLESIL